MKLLFNEKKIKEISKNYVYQKESTLEVLSSKRKSVLTKEELKIICNWKSPRSASHVNKNADDYVKEITTFVFSAKNERVKIEALTLLDGVGWPTASVILH